MTMNVAGALAMVLCLTVTSGQQELGGSKTALPISELSFATEEENVVSFEKNDTNLVKLYNSETEAIEVKVASDSPLASTHKIFASKSISSSVNCIPQRF